MLAETLHDMFRGNPRAFAVEGEHWTPKEGELTVEDIEKHLAGEHSVGVYLLDRDRVFCSCVDFDNHDGVTDARGQCAQLVSLMRLEGIPFVVEQSQSGLGYHVWMLHGEWVPARIVRAVWRHLLHMADLPKLTEVYPRQDEVEGDRLGNLIRLPLWGKSKFGKDPTTVEKAPESLLTAFLEKYDVPVAQPTERAGDGESDPSAIPKAITALRALPAELADDYHMWVKVGMACKAVSEELYPHWVVFSKLSQKFCGESECKRKWYGFPVDSNLSLGTLYFLAREHGSWGEEPCAAEGFEFTTIAAARKRADALGPVDYIRTGIEPLDDSIDGLEWGALTIVGGLPNHGKSLVGYRLLASAAKQGYKGLFISIEMSDIELARRAHTADDTRDIFVLEGLTKLADILQAIRVAHDKYGVCVVVLDYLQLVKVGGHDPKRLEMADIATALKQLARELNISIVGLSQLNREVTRRVNDNSEPRASDLAESSGIENSADLILICWYNLKVNSEAPPNLYTFYCLKRRNGPINAAKVYTNINVNKQLIGGYYG